VTSAVQRIFGFWYDFIVGDDWRVAVGVLALLGLTAVVAHSASEAWAWVVLPVGTVVVLGASVVRAARG
jgi:hypothetical protein